MYDILKKIYIWFKNNIGLVVGIIAIIFGYTGQTEINNTLDEIEIRLEKAFTETSYNFNKMARDIKWASDRSQLRFNIYSVVGFIDNVLIKEALINGLAEESCLKITPKGEQLLNDLGIISKLNNIIIKNKEAQIENILIMTLSSDYIQRNLLKYSEENKESLVATNPLDINRILGAIAVYYNQYKLK